MRAVTIDSDLATLFTFTPPKPPITPIQGVLRAVERGGITRPMPATTVRVASRFRGPTSA